MFSLMGNCWSSRKTGPRRHLTLAILGLDNAGKTVTANILQGESLHTAPTIGFQKSDISFGRYDLTLFDLGGGKKIRAIWKKYLAEVYGIVYIVDASDSSRIEESTAVFKDLLEEPKVTKKPVLVLANKQDVEGALDEMDICDQMKLEEVVNANKCPCRVEMCSAIKGSGKKKDQTIKEGLDWLCDMINLDFNTLHDRVQTDLKQQDMERKKDLEERKARVQKLREEREREEAAERERLGVTEPESPDEDVVDGDPFRRLNYEELKQKEARLKEEKKQKKAQLDQNDNKAAEAVSSRVSNRLSAGLSDDDEDVIITSQSPRHSKLPPLHNRKPQLGDADQDIHSRKPSHDNHLNMLENHSDRKLSAYDNQLNPLENGYSGLSTDKRGVGRQLAPLVTGEQKPEKKRKKRVKKNKLVPMSGESEVTYLSDRSGERTAPLPWEDFSEPAQTISNTSQPDSITHISPAGYNWGLVEDLPEPIYGNGRPNFDSDDIVT